MTFLLYYATASIIMICISFFLTVMIGIYEPPWSNVGHYAALITMAIPVFLTVILLLYILKNREKLKK